MRVFDAYPVLDAEDFSSYLLRILAEALQREQSLDYEGYDLPDLSIEGKIHLVCKALSDSPDREAQRHSLDFNAAMIVSIIPLNKYLDVYDIGKVASACRDSIEATIKLAPSNVYIGAAAACRKIWSRYQTIVCRPDVSPYDDNCCFHEEHIQLLQQLTKRSHLEARSNALLACGAWLPVEIVDHVFEYLLVAEAVPLDVTLSKEDPMDPTAPWGLPLAQYSCVRIIKLFQDDSSHSIEKLERMRHHCRHPHETPGARSHELQGLLY